MRNAPVYFCKLGYRLSILWLLGCVVAASSSELPELGDSALINISKQQTQKIAKQVSHELRSSGKLVNDIEISDYLEHLGQRLVSASEHHDTRFQFFTLSDNEINAWAVPGGVIAVNTALIISTSDESALAAVIAHEIAHVTQHHYARMLEQQKSTDIASLSALALAILSANHNNDTGIALATATQGFITQRHLMFSRDFEREADRIGIQTLQRAGFESYAMADFFETLQRKHRYNDDNRLTFLRTHPVTAERIADSQARALQLQGKASSVILKQRVPSLDYDYSREKVRVLQLGRREAIRYYADSLKNGRYRHIDSVYYGQAYAYYLEGKFKLAWQSVQQARKAAPQTHPMLESLAGYIRLAQQQYSAAFDIFNSAQQQFPSAPGPIYGSIALHLAQQHYHKAVAVIEVALKNRPHDALLYQRLAEIYTHANKPQAAALALADYYQQLEQWPDAITQLQLARQSAQDDSQQQAVIDARIKALQAQADNEQSNFMP